MTIEEENDAVRRVLDGDADAFSPLVEAYQKNVYNLALRMTGNPEDALDMAQEAFIRAYNSLSSFRGDSKFSVWLYRIVSNVCLDFLRARKGRAAVSLSQTGPDGEDTALEIPDERALPEAELERALTRDAVRRGLQALPDDQREILLLREIQGLSYEEIAAALSLEGGTVKSRIFRARKKLCAYLLADGNISEVFSSTQTKEV
ncbi:MAG TPA: sigma-70 family RNA polymerase sigma factor [Oscillospiraceae bacterium]|nr:sigma-70 family RNA polymerase sigma factor [Oscillospiraceae bacterium]HNY00733.1 sigma-70 family RNA polymerase sigma factor [Oscillospiraceae bacterium]HPS76002.1 sigma-70 family RNA polymerase sigma factor [Oscillospiraceae bacterium]